MKEKIENILQNYMSSIEDIILVDQCAQEIIDFIEENYNIKEK